MTIHKKGQAHWEGDIKRGKGTVSTESGVLNQQPYGFNTRFEGEKGTNPEELIGAALFGEFRRDSGIFQPTAQRLTPAGNIISDCRLQAWEFFKEDRQLR